MLNLLCLVLVIGNVFGVCPPQFKEVSKNVCMIASQTGLEYCDAHEFCAQMGERNQLSLFLVGEHLDLLKQAFPNNIPKWTSAHDMLGIFNHSETDWMVGDPADDEFKSSVKKFRCKSAGEKVRGKRILYVDKEVKCTWQKVEFPYQAVCEISQHQSERKERMGVIKTTYFLPDWPVVLKNIFHDNVKNSGCFENKIAKSTLDCARR